MQRFGSYSIRTHQVGKEILNHNWKEVIRLILIQHADYLPHEKARKQRIVDLVFDEKADGHPHEMQDNIEEAMEILDRRDRLERTVLQSLRGSPNGYYNAFVSISKHTRYIYIHAYQSYIWNQAVSARLRKFGNQVLIGDLVINKEAAELLEAGDEVREDIEEAEEKKEEAKDGEENIKHKENQAF